MAVNAEKGGMKTVFTDMVWKNMGTNKNGWTEVVGSEKAPLGKLKVPTPLPAKELPTAPGPLPAKVPEQGVYKMLVDKAKGLETDGLIQLALNMYLEASAIKETKGLMAKIEKLTAVMDNVTGAQELLVNAEAALVSGDTETALELVKQSIELNPTDEATALLTKVEEAELN